jgi:hypothetical protein
MAIIAFQTQFSRCGVTGHKETVSGRQPSITIAAAAEHPSQVPALHLTVSTGPSAVNIS